jgi:eukaryotic-like serine/threonine-protein kinase
MSATPGSRAKELYEFGPFRVDPEKQTLLRNGKSVPLAPKSFQLLLVLVRHSNEVVTKEELMRSVWPDTFVEEANLSRNIFMLRKALGDNSEDRYVVTMPGIGYRLAENAHLLPEQDVSILAANRSKVQIQIEESKPWGWIALVLIAALAVVAVATHRLQHHTRVLSSKDTVVLADFSNSTGDPVFEGTLRQGMAVQLEQSPFLSLISDGRIQRTLRLMGQPAEAPLTPETALDICVRTGSAAVLEGSIAPIGSQYVLGLRARNCRTGDVLDEEQAQAARKEDVLNALSRIARKFRTRVGESLTTVEKYSIPLDEATTPSLEALKAFSASWRVGFTSGFPAAIPLLKRAIEIDPNFALAHAQLGLWYSDIGESVLSIESTTKAYQLRDRTSYPEKFFIATTYDRHVTGNLAKAQTTCRLWVQTYPRDARPHGLISGFIYQGEGKYEESIEEAKKALELDPDLNPAYLNLAYSYYSLDHFKDAQTAIRRATDRKVDFPEFAVLRYYISFMTGDTAGMQRTVTSSRKISGAEEWIAQADSLTSAYSGRLQQAARKSQHAVDVAQEAGLHEQAATFEASTAVWQAFFGNTAAAKERANAALDLSRGRDVEYAAAVALAMSGEASQSQTLAVDLERRFPEDTSVQFNYLPALRGLRALNHNEPTKAIELLQTATSHELAVTGSTFFAFFGMFYPVYFRGEAYLAAHQGTEAAKQFQNILNHRGLAFNDPIGALARLQLARAYEMSGNETKAKATYEDFLSLWKDADPEVKAIQEAKAEYAKVRSCS